MKCPHCNMEWMNKAGVTDSLKNCPFCGGTLAQKKPESLEDCLRQVIQQSGKDSLRNGKALIGIHSDLFPDRHRDRRLLTLLILCEGNVSLLDARKKDAGEQSIALSRLASKMEKDWMIQPEAIREVCTAFWRAVGGNQDVLRALPEKASPQSVPQQKIPVSPPGKKQASMGPSPIVPAGLVLNHDDYIIASGQINKYCGQATCIRIPDGVVSINPAAFSQFKEIRKIFFPDGFLTVSAAAFSYSGDLEWVRFPESLRTIGARAFWMSGLVSVRIPGSVKTIKNRAFGSCRKLKEVELLPGVQRIDAQAFMGCPALKTIRIPDSVCDIAPSAFQSCSHISVIATDRWKKAHPDLLERIP